MVKRRRLTVAVMAATTAAAIAVVLEGTALAAPGGLAQQPDEHHGGDGHNYSHNNGLNGLAHFFFAASLRASAAGVRVSGYVSKGARKVQPSA